MPHDKQSITAIHQRIIPHLHSIYDDFAYSGKPAGLHLPKPHKPSEDKRNARAPFAGIPLIFEGCPGTGIFLGDSSPEKTMGENWGLHRTAVVININRTNIEFPNASDEAIGLLLAHEYGHAYSWYMGFGRGSGSSGEPRGYQNETWARSMELVYLKALREGDLAKKAKITYQGTLQFAKKHRKSLYKSSEGEKKFYTEISGDSDWKSQAQWVCPDPECRFTYVDKPFLHKHCKT